MVEPFTCSHVTSMNEEYVKIGLISIPVNCKDTAF